MDRPGNDLNLLYICHQYNNFQKDQIEALRPYYSHATCLVRENPLFRYGSYLPLGALRAYRHGHAFDCRGIPDGITVHPVQTFYLPTERSHGNLADRVHRSSHNVIKKHQIDFDLIHAHFLWTSGEVGRLLKNRYSKPMVATAHGFDVYSLPFKNDFWMERIKTVLGSCDHVITVSRSNRECIERIGVNTPISVIPNGFNPKMFRLIDRHGCRARLGIPEDTRVILNVGNLDEVKGHRYLLDALHALSKNGEDYLCVIIGSGPLESTLKQQARDLGIQDRVQFRGYQRHEMIPVWMNAADLFVLSSINEGNPTVMFESMGCGLPFLSTSVGGVPEIVQPETGLVVPCQSPMVMAEAISQGLRKKWNREQIQKMSEDYTWDSIALRIAEIYHEVLD